VRHWLIENGFQGKDGQKIPEMSDEWVWEISDRYIELFEKLTGEKFEKSDTTNIEQRVENNILSSLKRLHVLQA
jgi:phosphoribosylaminoimidazole-succinocarboxamide synthase